jgi:hypothetical protein
MMPPGPRKVDVGGEATTGNPPSRRRRKRPLTSRRIAVPPPRVDLTDRFTAQAVGTETKYKCGDPRTHGLAATLKASGQLSFFVSAGGDKETLGGGRDMFVSLMLRMHRDGVEVREIEGAWTGEVGTRQSDNLDEFVRNLESMPQEEAAKHTWTGRRAAEFGFTQASVPFPLEKVGRAHEVRAVFSKPSSS